MLKYEVPIQLPPGVFRKPSIRRIRNSFILHVQVERTPSLRNHVDLGRATTTVICGEEEIVVITASGRWLRSYRYVPCLAAEVELGRAVISRFRARVRRYASFLQVYRPSEQDSRGASAALGVG